MKRRFHVRFVATVEIDDAVCKSVLTDEWRADFYPIRDREQVAEHVAFNLVRGSKLSQLDGFADLPDSAAQLLEFWPDDAREVRR